MPRYDGRNYFIVKHHLRAFEVLPNFVWRSGLPKSQMPPGFRQIEEGDRWLGFAYTDSYKRERRTSLITGFFECTKEARYGEVRPPSSGLWRAYRIAPFCDHLAGFGLTMSGRTCGTRLGGVVGRLIRGCCCVIALSAHNAFSRTGVDAAGSFTLDIAAATSNPSFAWPAATVPSLVQKRNATVPDAGAARFGSAGESEVPATTGAQTLGLNHPGIKAVRFDPDGGGNAVATSTAGPKITTQPQSQTCAVGLSAAFTIGVADTQTLTYQWLRLAAGASEWVELAESSIYGGNTTDTLAVDHLTMGMNGDPFCCVVSDSEGTATSDPAVLTVEANQHYLFLSDHNLATNGQSGIVRIDKVSGAQTLVTQGGYFGDLFGIVAESPTTLIGIDSASESIVRVDVTTGQQTMIVQSPALNNPGFASIGQDGFLYVSNSGQTGATGSILKVNPCTGMYPADPAIGVYCMGDSLTWSCSPYLSQFFGSGYVVYNLGIGGNRTGQMLARFTDSVITPEDSRFVVILGGINDLVHATESVVATIEGNLQAMYTAAHAAGIKVVAVTITPFKGSTSWTVARQAEADTINAWILNTASDVDYRINAYAALEDPDNPDALLPAYAKSDLLHLVPTGDLALESAIYNGTNWSLSPAAISAAMATSDRPGSSVFHPNGYL
jgi:lysophospholipase L1-like esterase